MIEVFDDWSEHYRKRVNGRLQLVLSSLRSHVGSDARLVDSMAYSLLGGGKRVRPLLVYAAGELAGAEPGQLDAAAAAVEMVHCYSLIHDDLPAMDDDELRRGQPTLHIAFGEATAILAGDALLTEAFTVLAQAPQTQPDMRLQSILMLARASGGNGMVAGQMLDMSMEGTQPSTAQVETMFALKTGALLHASAILGVLAAGRGETDPLYGKVSAFAEAIGLCFQIQDDIIDVTSDTASLGKPQGSDAARGKPNYALRFGLDHARQRADDLYQSALAALADCNHVAEPLRQLGAMITKRNH